MFAVTATTAAATTAAIAAAVCLSPPQPPTQMRNAVKASRDGYVDEVLVKEDDIVTADQPLIKFW